MKAVAFRILLLIGLLGLSSLAFAQDTEPNHPCPSAQDLGAATLPFVQEGSLDSVFDPPPQVLDVDFFRLTGTPGDPILLDLEGGDTGAGPLGDPFLGVFDSGCITIAMDDDGGVGLNSRLAFTIPTDGVFILGVTLCCDSEFLGGGVGTYRLTIRRFLAFASITGRVVDAATGDPVTGSAGGIVELLRCNAADCSESVASLGTDDEGRFRFDSTTVPAVDLLIGSYQVRARSPLHEPGLAGPFSVAEGEDRDLGDIPLVLLPQIGSISGRAVDALSAEPLAGDREPFAFVNLIRCDDVACTSGTSVAAQSTGPDGRFAFASPFFGSAIVPGTYQVEIAANQYQPGRSAPAAVAEGADVDLGDVPVTPVPMQLLDPQVCDSIVTPSGEIAARCTYRVRVRNATAQRFRGAAWSVINAFGIGSPVNFTVFQAGEPKKLTLDAGESEVVRFTVRIPETVAVGALVCPSILVGTNRRYPFFNTTGSRDFFCVVKGESGLSVITGNEALMRRDDMMRRQQPALPRPQTIMPTKR
ncbi:MAG: MSCRAMM family protein [Gammaproteobacteria bacterium]